MTSTYADPSTPSGVDLKSLLGALLLITVHEHLTGDKAISTSFGPAEPIRCDVAVLDGPSTGEVHADTLIFPRVLIGQLRPNIGKKVLGRLGQGTAKPGQSAPWTLLASSDDDKATAVRYETHVAASAVTSVDAPF